MTQFTANEVRDWERAYKGTGAAKVFGAFADLLEAQERAVPVMVVNHVSSAEHDLPIGMKLYAHPSPSDTERLAEALRAKIRRLRNMPNGEFQLAASIFADDLERILAAHSAQTQPPATSVPDEMVERARSAFVQADDGSTGITDAIRTALLAALENPNG